MGPGELVGGLGDGPHRQQQEGGVAVEGDQLADADAAGHGQAGPQPGHRGHEHAREGDLGRVQQRLDPGGGHPGRADLLGGGGVAAGEDLLAADAAQHPQPADGVGPDGGEAADQLAVAGPAPVQGCQQRADRGRQQRHPDRHQQPQGGRGAQHQGGHDRERHHRAGQPGDGGDPPGQRPAEPGRLADQQLLDPVGGGEPVHHRRPVAQDPGGGADEPGGQDQTRPAQQPGGVAAGHAGVDGPPDQGRDHGQGGHPDDPVHRPNGERAGLPARHPQQEAGRRAQVRSAGMSQRELAHPSTVPAPPAAENRIAGRLAAPSRR
jgi:hypothetical protein